MDKKVIIETYKEYWQIQFEEEKKSITEILSGQFIAIEHIGSTSIEGLGAKPILDIAIGVEKLKVTNEYIKPLAKIGYEFVDHEEFPERRFFRKGEWRAGTHHVHIYEFKSEHWNNHILFRNYLRENTAILKEYEQLKKKLAKEFTFDRVKYTQGKSNFIQNVIKKAKKEAETSVH
ncbi:GrpB-like predicted nucleotidyltransferase (UPF0157 family) [Bacillus pakistanensis]|uniref:GrpB-like predicted nucleotidyltransferase (UPF0157 family) n=1 Tax=Rossellomorea pakistanensis TaxID=992288 RepID=A0ABS2NDV0_9BACI|nr:GrpB family protein [Bacillus pakistanensis]MBM7586033.1 GrpB-like predicted nucleotidyltransferase (UPF0157 family) [Bacillus pakistanensis]